MIPYGRQEITQDDIDAVVETLKSDFLTQGPLVERFEQAIASYCGARHAVAVSSCTAALHIAYMAMGISPGKLVWTSPNTFVATANGALYCGADVDFVDIDPRTYNMSVTALSLKLAAAKEAGRLPDIVAPVHFSGQSCDMVEIKKLGEQYGFQVLEDAAHCTGASYRGEKIGSCSYSKATVFSFHPVKIITTGEGGLITTNDAQLYQQLLLLRNHGITRDKAQMERQNEGAWYFEQQTLGYHYRLTDMQCALGLSQMNRLDAYVEKRRELAARYHQKLADLPLQLPHEEDGCYSSWHLYVVVLKDANPTRREVFDRMREHGIGVNVHYIPVYTHPYFRTRKIGQGNYPVTESYYNHTLTLPLYPGMTIAEQDFICETLARILNENA